MEEVLVRLPDDDYRDPGVRQESQLELRDHLVKLNFTCKAESPRDRDSTGSMETILGVSRPNGDPAVLKRDVEVALWKFPDTSEIEEGDPKQCDLVIHLKNRDR